MRWNRTVSIYLVLMAGALLGAPAYGQVGTVWTCPMEIEPPPGEVGGESHTSGGMAGDGWDGAGANAATIYWHVEGTTSNTGSDQRQAIINALQRWAGVVQITFEEVPTANRDQSIDIHFLGGDHSATEPAEAGDPDCPFTSSNPLAHAGFPPGVASTCVNPMPETFSGNVHLNTAFTWEADDAAGAGAFSIELIGSHEIGHGIGLTHSGGGDIMRASFSDTDAAHAPTANDTHNLQEGYSAGIGSVTTLEQTGIWVDQAAVGNQWGVPDNEFDTVLEGVQAVPEFAGGVEVNIAPGVYTESLTISSGASGRSFTLRVDGAGVVVIGN